MSRATLADARAEVYGLLWSSSTPTFSVSDVDAAAIHVYDHEPRELEWPINVTLAFGGSTVDFWVITVRIYASTVRLDAKTAQDQLDLLMPAVEAKATSNGGYDAQGWSPLTWDDGLEAFVVANDLLVGRQDVY